MRSRLLVPLLVFGVVTAACGSSADSEPASGGTPPPTTDVVTPSEPDTTEPGTPEPDAAGTPDPTTPPTDTASPVGRDTVDVADLPTTIPPDLVGAPPAIVGEVPEALLGPVLADAADRTGSAPSGLVVVRAQEMQWSDGSLGCARPGEFYTQAVVPGYWVVVDAAGQLLDYRMNERGFFVLCDSPLPSFPDGAPTS